MFWLEKSTFFQGLFFSDVLYVMVSWFMTEIEKKSCLNFWWSKLCQLSSYQSIVSEVQSHHCNPKENIHWKQISRKPRQPVYVQWFNLFLLAFQNNSLLLSLPAGHYINKCHSGLFDVSIFKPFHTNCGIFPWKLNVGFAVKCVHDARLLEDEHNYMMQCLTWSHALRYLERTVYSRTHQPIAASLSCRLIVQALIPSINYTNTWAQYGCMSCI